MDPPLFVDFLVVQRAPPLERAEFWVDLINDDENTIEFRAFCLRLLFLRHLRVGESPQKFAKLSGTDGWFDRETLIPMASASALPLERTGFGYYAFVPHFAPDGEVAVYMQLSYDIDLDDLVAAMTGKMTNFEDLRVVDISVH